MANIGKPVRIIEVVPLKEPVIEPEPAMPEPEPIVEPEQEPAPV